MLNRNDIYRYVDDKFRLLTHKIEGVSEIPSQEEMNEIIALIDEIYKLNHMLGETDIENNDIINKK